MSTREISLNTTISGKTNWSYIWHFKSRNRSYTIGLWAFVLAVTIIKKQCIKSTP